MSDVDCDIEMMDSSYYPLAYVLIILSSMSSQCMNVSAVVECVTFDSR